MPKGNCYCMSRLVDTRRKSWNYNRKWADEFHYCLQRVQLKKTPSARKKKRRLRSLNCNSVKDMDIVGSFNKYRIPQSLSHTRSRKWMQYFGRNANVYIVWNFACGHKRIPQYRSFNGICAIHVNNIMLYCPVTTLSCLYTVSLAHCFSTKITKMLADDGGFVL